MGQIISPSHDTFTMGELMRIREEEAKKIKNGKKKTKQKRN